MKDTIITSTQLIADSYVKYHQLVYLYIYYKIGNKEDAEDLSQDVFLRLMDYDQMLREDAVKSFIFTISRNLVIDFLRRSYKEKTMLSFMYEHMERHTEEMESHIVANDLLSREKYKLSLLPPQRRAVYMMNRFEGKSSPEIARELNISVSTAENHLFTSRKEVREYMRKYVI